MRRRPAPDPVRDAVDAVVQTLDRCATDKAAPPLRPPRQLPRHVPELGGEILVDVKHMHFDLFS